MKIFIFGSTGDLVKRKILHSLHEFKGLEVYAIGRKLLNDREYAENYCVKCDEKFKDNLRYIPVDYTKDLPIEFYERLSKKDTNYFYIALTPHLILDVLKKINNLRKRGFHVSILIEKPFGNDIKDAERIKSYIIKENMEKEIFLADHYLFKEGISEIPKNFKEIKIVSLEELGAEGRKYYDSVGALRDMVQSHFMNILFKFISPEDFKGFKIENLRVGQYKGYKEEMGIKSNTETFAELSIRLKNNNRIEFMTGKKMKKKDSYAITDKSKKINLGSNNKDYIRMFNEFFKNKRDEFPSIENAVFSWKFINNIEKRKGKLFLY